MKIGSYEVIPPEIVAKNLDRKLEWLVQDSYTVHYIGKNQNEIKLLEEIRGRPYMTCTICNTDLTIKICEHHSKGGKFSKSD